MGRRFRAGRYAHTAIQHKDPEPVTFDSLLERVKQGNSLELEIVENFKKGLLSVAESMESECYNRSDALTELRTMMEEERAKLDPASTTERKETLSMKLEEELNQCCAAQDQNETRLKEAMASVHADFQRETSHVAQIQSRDFARGTRFVKFLEQMVTELPDTKSVAWGMFAIEQDANIEELAATADAQKAIQESAEKRAQAAQASYNDAKEILEQRMKALKDIAEMLDIPVSSEHE